MFKVIYKDNVCVVAATKKVLDNKISFYWYDKRIKEWLWVHAAETVPFEE